MDCRFTAQNNYMKMQNRVSYFVDNACEGEYNRGEGGKPPGCVLAPDRH